MKSPNLKTLIAAFTVAAMTLGITSYAIAAADYERLKKDINVMMSIVRSAFETAEDCDQCSVSITGHYLADQGVVFDVSAKTNQRFFAIDAYNDLEIHTEGLATAIPEFVSEILADVEISLEGSSSNGEFTTATIISDGNWADLSEEVRESLREARIEMRELSREMRELQIEAIHAQEDAERKEIEVREKALASEMASLTARKDTLTEDVTVMIRKRQEERDARIARRNEERQARFSKIEKVVLDSFCDYSRTIRSLPKGERISIIMKQEDASKIYVLEQDDIENCDSAETDLRKHALSYAF